MGEDYTIADYKRDVRALFGGGKATDEQWEALGKILNSWSANGEYDEDDFIRPIDDELLGKRVECKVCGSMYRPKMPCWGCSEV